MVSYIVDILGFYLTLFQLSLPFGTLLGTLVSSACILSLSDDQYFTWGWRIPLMCCIVPLLLGWYIKANFHETKDFQQIKDRGEVEPAPLMESFGNFHNLRNVLLLLITAAGVGSVFFTSHIFSLSFLQHQLAIPQGKALTIGSLAFFSAIPIYILVGCFKKIIAKYFMVTGLLLASGSYFLTYNEMLKRQNHYSSPNFRPLMIYALLLPQTISSSLALAPLARFTVGFFRAEIRYSSISLPFLVGFSISLNNPSDVWDAGISFGAGFWKLLSKCNFHSKLLISNFSRYNCVIFPQLLIMTHLLSNL